MKFVRTWGPVILWMVLIFLGSTRQRIVVSQEYTINFLFFKTLHVLEYGFLYLLTYRAMKLSYPKKTMPFWSWWAFVIVILYASSDEIHQLFVVTREGTVRDVIIDGLGATLSWISIQKLLPRLPKKLQHWVHKSLAI